MKTFICFAAAVDSSQWGGKTGWTKAPKPHGKPVGLPVKGLDLNYNVQKDMVCDDLDNTQDWNCSDGFKETSVCQTTCGETGSVKTEKVCACHRIVGNAKLFLGCRWLNKTENACLTETKKQIISTKIDLPEKEQRIEKEREIKPKEDPEEEESRIVVVETPKENKVKYATGNCEKLEDMDNWSCVQANKDSPVVMTCSRLCQTKDRFRTVRNRCICIAGKCRWQKAHVQSCPNLRAGLILPPVSLKSAGSADKSESQSLFSVFSAHVTDKAKVDDSSGKYVHPFEFLQKFQSWMYDSGLLSPQNKDLLIEM